MIAAVIYLIVFLALIYKTNFFGVIKDEIISSKTFTILFLLKSLSIPAFVIIYKKFYGGLENFDAGNFYNDAKAVNTFAHHHFLEYLKMLVGLQNDNDGSFCYNNCLIYTHNWDNGRIRDFLYNDNRVVIRVHSLLHFIAFNSYYVHALFSCFLSFIGITYLYKALKEFFIGKEIWVLLILCFFPTLWFYTGSLSKEALTLFFLGCGVYQIRKFILKDYKYSSVLFLIFIVFVSFLLKPYVLLFSFVCFALFFKIQYSKKTNYKLIIYFSSIFIFILLLNITSLFLKNKSLYRVAMARQRVFADASTGGIFLLDSKRTFVRLEYDSTLVKKIKPNYYTITLNAPYIYWENSHQQDTLLCKANTDTTTKYTLVYQLPKSGSNFILPDSFLYLSASGFYYTLFYPLFFNSKNSLQLIASLENVFIILSLILIIMGLVRSNKQKFIPITLISITLIVCFLIGITTPNSGAVIRYRSLVVIFILLSALYYFPIKKIKN